MVAACTLNIGGSQPASWHMRTLFAAVICIHTDSVHDETGRHACFDCAQGWRYRCVAAGSQVCLCVSLCLCVNVYMRLRVWMCVCVCVWMYACVYVCMYLWLRLPIRICMCVRERERENTCASAAASVNACVWVLYCYHTLHRDIRCGPSPWARPMVSEIRPNMKEVFVCTPIDTFYGYLRLVVSVFVVLSLSEHFWWVLDIWRIQAQ